jgi:hypothetical protein
MGGGKVEGAGAYDASVADIETYDVARRQMAEMQVPVLYQNENPNSYLYVANFDGSGHDVSRHNSLATNVGEIHLQVEGLKQLGQHRVAGGYAAGPGSQRNPVLSIFDTALAFSYDDRIIDAYVQFARQARIWRQENPHAEINIASIGYSRGATLIPGFARLVERYGILDPTGLRFHKDQNSELVATSPRPPLVPPGHTAHAVVLFDPVSTSLPKHYDLRLPGSVISGYSLLAADELRWLFRHTTMIGDGVTPDGRFGRSIVAGAHSDVGGGNRANGLEIRSGNLGVAYLNALMDRPLFSPRTVPEVPAMNVIHRSEQAMFGVFAIGASSRGQRYVRERLCVVVDPCTDAMPRDEVLAARFEYRSPPVRAREAVQLHDPGHPGHALFQQARHAVHALDAHQGAAHAPDSGSERLAAALAVAAKRDGLQAIDHVIVGERGSRMFAVEGALHDPAQRRVAIDTVPALAQPVEESARLLESLPVDGLARRQGAPASQPQLVPAF